MSDNGAHEQPGADATASGGIKAGEAFRRLLETDPATQAAWKRVRARFQAIVKAFRVFMELDPETRAAWDREWAQLREELADAWAAEMQELEARDFPRPETIEDWEHLARILGLSREEIGNMTVGEIFDEARAFADRWSLLFQWQAKTLLSAESSVPTSHSRPDERDDES